MTDHDLCTRLYEEIDRTLYQFNSSADTIKILTPKITGMVLDMILSPNDIPGLIETHTDLNHKINECLGILLLIDPACNELKKYRDAVIEFKRHRILLDTIAG
jgi:hypothetical protein